MGIEPVDDFLAMKICFLLIDTYLQVKDPESAQTVLAYVEKPSVFRLILKCKSDEAAKNEKVVSDLALELDDGDDIPMMQSSLLNLPINTAPKRTAPDEEKEKGPF